MIRSRNALISMCNRRRIPDRSNPKSIAAASLDGGDGRLAYIVASRSIVADADIIS